MKRQYRISPRGRGTPLTEAEIARYRDPKRLLFNYQKAVRRPQRPLYKDPKAFIALLLIVLLAWVLSEASERHPDVPATEPTEQHL